MSASPCRRGGVAMAALSAVWVATAAHAADADLPRASQMIERPLWELGLGAAALRLPHYRGSDQSHNWLLPVPYVVYRGNIFRADRDGARAVLVETDRFDFDLSVAAGAPTRSQDNRAREGMPDLAPTLELGPNLNWRLGRGPGWKLDLRAPLRAVFTVESSPQAIGWAATPNLNLDTTRLIPGWNVGLQAGPVFGDARLHRHYYDVGAALATAARPAYRADGGYAGVQITTALSRRFDKLWIGAFARFDSLAGATFADSPLVRSRQQLSVGLAVSWVLWTSSTLVTTAE